jgi:hypothetical protein
MKKALTLTATLVFVLAMSLFAQQHQHAGNGGHPPPAPPRRSHSAPAEIEHTPDGRDDPSQHVNNDHWYGHPPRNDPRFHIDHPYAHGHFNMVGPGHPFGILRIDTINHQFWFPGGYGFEIAAWDWDVASAWCWTTCGDEFVVYVDSDHPGWYLLYNMDTGAYVHVQYIGM